MKDLTYIGRIARNLSLKPIKPEDQKNKCLELLSNKIMSNIDKILLENDRDIKKFKNVSLSKKEAQKLSLDKGKIFNICNNIIKVRNSESPLGKVENGFTLEDKILVQKITFPIGVISVINEGPSSMITDFFSISLKTGNKLIFFGNRYTPRTNICFYDMIKQSLEETGFPEGYVQLLDFFNKKSDLKLLKMKEYVDLLIPVGNSKLMNVVEKNSNIPFIKIEEGIGYIFIDKSAQIDTVSNIICSAIQSIDSHYISMGVVYVHEKVILDIYNHISYKMRSLNILTKIVPYKGTCKFVCPPNTIILQAVKDIDQAIENIKENSTGHCDCIITNDYMNAQKFISSINSSILFLNTYTNVLKSGNKFSGVGISSEKMFIRGMIGLENLVSYKYIMQSCLIR